MFKGKAIYNPSGKAGEYSYWACNFYTGCSNGCTYCYLKKGRGAKILGGDKPELKKCFKNEDHAIEIFEKEVKQNISELEKHGIFFSFTTDPMLPETYSLTIKAAIYATAVGVPVKILTKRTDWLNNFLDVVFDCDNNPHLYNRKNMFAIGFTLTGHDELEPGANTNSERIKAMECLSMEGFKTFASIEPVVDIISSGEMIIQTSEFCDLYKIGLMSGIKYDKRQINFFVKSVSNFLDNENSKIYWKDSLLKTAGIERKDLPNNCVSRDYNLFES